MSRVFYLLCLLPALVAAPVPMMADVIYLKNGDRITGEIKEMWDDNVTIEPEYSEKFEVEYEHIAGIESDRPMEVELFDGTRGEYQLEQTGEAGRIRLTASYSQVEVALADIKKTEKLERFQWDANLDVSSSFSRGNTNSQTTNVGWKGRLKVGDHRYQTDLTITREELDGVKTKEKDRMVLGYNYLFHEDWFFALNATLERAPITQQLDRRISINPALGYDVWDNPDRVLNFQLGVGYADETTDGEDESSTNIDWRLNFEWDFRGGDLAFFHNHNIYRSLQGRKNMVLNSQTGIRYDITDDIYLNLQANYDYDSEPAEGAEHEDLTFLIGAGLEF